MDKSTLLNYMPNYYRTSKVIDNLNTANAIELDSFDKKLDGILNQFFIDTADFSLERWEKELGIEVNNNYNIDFRRSKILSKLRGQGTVTVGLIQNVSESFANGEVSVIENNPDYSFKIRFIGTLGTPPNLADLKDAIEQIKPAHLGVVYEFTYNTYQVLQEFSHEHLQGYTNEQLRGSTIT